MKLRHPIFLKAAGLAIAGLVRLWGGSVRYHVVVRGRACEPTAEGMAERFIYSFWHENILLCGRRYMRTPTHVLISKHADGEMIANACTHLGLKTVRGSSDKRGAAEAVREMLKLAGKRHIVFTPDGPRGPRREVQGGLIYTASRSGLPIVPVGFGYRSAWRMKSWDRFALPVPFGPAVGVIGEPLRVPPKLDRPALEEWRERVQEMMDDVQAEAERRAAGRSW